MEVMKTQAYQLIKEHQFNHWWFLGRQKIIAAWIKHHTPRTLGNLEILDVGAGYGALVPTLRQFGDVDVLEPYLETHPILQQLGTRKIYSITDFPLNWPDHRYDIVTLFDVLAHIEKDLLTLKTIKENLLKKKGACFLTVPAYSWLWSKHDEIYGHYRRYIKRNLIHLLRESGFENIQVSYFMTLLFPLAVLSRLALKLNFGETDLKKIPRFANKPLATLFGLESKCIRRFNLPYGLNILAKATSS